MKAIFNHEVIALEKEVWVGDICVGIDFEKSYFTPYGFFCPFNINGMHFVRVLQGELSARDLKEVDVNSIALYVTHTGYAGLAVFDALKDVISHERVTSRQWSIVGFRGEERGNSIAYGHLLKGCATIEKAVARIDKLAYDGFYEPAIYRISQIAERLKELGHTKPFIHTKVSTL